MNQSGGVFLVAILVQLIFMALVTLGPPALIRFAIFRKALGKKTAWTLSVIFFICNHILFVAIGESKGKIGLLIGLFACKWVLSYRKKTDVDDDETSDFVSQEDASSPPSFSDSPVNVSEITTNLLRLWVELIKLIKGVDGEITYVHEPAVFIGIAGAMPIIAHADKQTADMFIDHWSHEVTRFLNQSGVNGNKLQLIDNIKISFQTYSRFIGDALTGANKERYGSSDPISQCALELFIRCTGKKSPTSELGNIRLFAEAGPQIMSTAVNAFKISNSHVIKQSTTPF